MRISDWSSDVCSSDLLSGLVLVPGEPRLQLLLDGLDAHQAALGEQLDQALHERAVHGIPDGIPVAMVVDGFVDVPERAVGLLFAQVEDVEKGTHFLSVPSRRCRLPVPRQAIHPPPLARYRQAPARGDTTRDRKRPG